MAWGSRPVSHCNCISPTTSVPVLNTCVGGARTISSNISCNPSVGGTRSFLKHFKKSMGFFSRHFGQPWISFIIRSEDLRKRGKEFSRANRVQTSQIKLHLFYSRKMLSLKAPFSTTPSMGLNMRKNLKEIQCNPHLRSASYWQCGRSGEQFPVNEKPLRSSSWSS